MIPPPSRFTLFPYTSLFRSWSTVVLLVEPEIVHPASLYSVKLIVPVGLVPRVRCATSDTCPPAATEPLAVVVRSEDHTPVLPSPSLHLCLARLVLASPE